MAEGKGPGGLKWLATTAIVVILAGLACWVLRPHGLSTPRAGNEPVPTATRTSPSPPRSAGVSKSPAAPVGDGGLTAASPGEPFLSPQPNPQAPKRLPKGLTQAALIRGYCEAMYALRDDGRVDVRALAALDNAAMAAKDAGERDKELDYNVKAFHLASQLLENSFSEKLARARVGASADRYVWLEDITNEFRTCMKSGDLVGAVRGYRELLKVLDKK